MFSTISSCARCTLAKENDFVNQKSGLEEVYIKHNQEYNTKHYCIFLPKFHPELNPIERVWCRMKWHCRKFCTGNLDDLTTFMSEGLSPDVLPIAMIRKFVRLQRAYILAYKKKLNIIQGTAWIKQRKSHRGYAAQMDEALEKLYYPLGRNDTAAEEIIDDSDDAQRAEVVIRNDVVVEDDESSWNLMIEEMNEENFELQRFQQQRPLPLRPDDEDEN
jgi:transposase